MFCKVALAGAASAFVGTLVAETYTIDVPEGVVRPFAAAEVEAINSGAYTLVRKTGRGTLVATNETTEAVATAADRKAPISAYAGDFDICEGVYLVHYNGAFGADGGCVAVTNQGAVHVMSKLGGENRLKWTNEKFVFAGEGPDGQGSLYNYSTCGDEYNLFGAYSTVSLADDTRWRSKHRVDLRYHATLSLNGHRLLLDWYDTNGVRTFALTTTPFKMGTGALELSRTAFHLSPAGTFEAEAGASLVISNKSRFVVENSLPLVQDLKPIALTIDDATLCAEAAGCPNVYAGNTGTNANNFTGPVTLRNTATVEGIGTGSPWTFGGPVSGDGTLVVKKARLQFGARGNTYAGKIRVDGEDVANRSMTGVRFYEGTDVPPASEIELTNAQLYLAESDTFALPPLRVSGSAEFIGGLATNPVRRSTAVSLVKTGEGELLWDAALDVTGAAAVEGGVLRLAKPKLGNPGLGEGRGLYQQPAPAGAWNWYYANGPTAWTSAHLNGCSTIRREGPAAAFSRAEWRYYVCPLYHGYVWNRTDKTVTWDLACVLGTHAKIYIDGNPVDGTTGKWDSGMTAQAGQKTAAVTLTPGPHEISIALIDAKTRSDQTKAIPGPTIGWYNEWWPWSDRGLAYDPNGTIGAECTDASKLTKDYIKAHFLPFRDPGDGSLFTIDDTPTAAVDQRGYHPFFADLEVKAGAAIDLNGNDLAVGFVRGGGVVSNGTLTVKGGLTASAETLTVTGGVVFAAGATVRIPEGFPRRPKGTGARRYVLLEVEGEISGLPSVDAEANPYWRVERDGAFICLVYERGLAVIVR